MARPVASAQVRTIARRVAVTGVVALIVTFSLPLFETSTASGPSEEPHVMSAGWPRDWITQQSTLSPPGPYTYRVASPLENATTIDPAALAFSVLVVWAILCVPAAIHAVWVSSPRHRPKPRQTQGQASRR